MGTEIHNSLSNLVLEQEIADKQMWIHECLNKGDYEQIIQLLEKMKNRELNREIYLVVQSALNLCQVCHQQQIELDATWNAYQRALTQEKVLSENLAGLLSLLMSSTSDNISPVKIRKQQTDYSGSSSIQHLWHRFQNISNPTFEIESTENKLDAESAEELPLHLEQMLEPESREGKQTLLEVYCFGTFHIFIDGKEVKDWTGNKGKSILKFLLFHPGPIPREMLMETFWPGENPEITRRNLYQAIYVLRQSLQSKKSDLKYIITNNGSYLIDPGLTIWIDSEAFQNHVKIGQELIEINQPEKAIREYEAAIALYQDDFLPEDIYEDWLLLYREDLKNKYLEMINWLCRHYYEQGQFTFAINYARKIISQDHCREDAHRLLMRAYMKLGQRHLALKQYHQCVSYLLDELDVEPMPATQTLYEKVS